jgi:hypothetical protein
MLRKSFPLRPAIRFVFALGASAMAASPAIPAGNTAVPEPYMVSVLALAMAGVLIDRRLASRKPAQD